MVKTAKPAPVVPAAAGDLLPATAATPEPGLIADAAIAASGAVVMLWNNFTAPVPESLWKGHAYLLPPALALDLIGAGDARSATATDIAIAGALLRDLTSSAA